MFEWGVAQGIEMGRPSHLQARAEKIESLLKPHQSALS
jgi:hypothetical protein